MFWMRPVDSNTIRTYFISIEHFNLNPLFFSLPHHNPSAIYSQTLLVSRVFESGDVWKLFFVNGLIFFLRKGQ